MTDINELRLAQRQFEHLLGRETTERDFQQFFTKHPFVLSRSLPLKLQPQDIMPLGRPGKTEPDFIFYPHQQTPMPFYGVIELKRPDSRIISIRRRNVAVLSSSAQTALRQGIEGCKMAQRELFQGDHRVLFLGNRSYIFVIMGLTTEFGGRPGYDKYLQQIQEDLPANAHFIPYDVLLQCFTHTIPPRMFFLCPLRGASSGSGSIQRAVILAAGKGRRMGELTVDVPKPMLSVCGTPIVEHILSGLTSAGIREIYIVIGWRGEAIRDYCGSGEKWGISISYGNQGVQNGTGKAAEVARQFAGDSDFLLTYGDILVPPEAYQQTIRRFSETTSSGLLTVTYGEDVTKGLSVLLDKDFYVEDLIERPSDSQMKQLLAAGQLKPYGSVWRDAGIYIFRSSLFDFTCRLECSPRGEYELTDAVKKMLISGRRLVGLEIGNRWVDVRNPEVLASLQRPSSFVD